MLQDHGHVPAPRNKAPFTSTSYHLVPGFGQYLSLSQAGPCPAKYTRCSTQGEHEHPKPNLKAKQTRGHQSSAAKPREHRKSPYVSL